MNNPAQFRYLHQTVEHCLQRPMPSNVKLVHRTGDRRVYTVDLPASVWAVVTVDELDDYDNDLHTFPSPSLRQEWIDNYIGSLQSARP
jgi:hypothetical protein